MNQFTIRDIENLCGIKAHTLRIWEQRYNLCVARRKQSQHRIYNNDDLKELLRVSFLYHNGHKISKIAELSSSDIHKLVENACVGENNPGLFIHQLIEAGIDMDKDKFEKLVNCLVLRVGLEKCIKEVFYPFLERIGLLWLTNHVIPAQEHFVSHIIRKKIILAIDGLESPAADAKKIIVFAPVGEHHEIPLLAVNYFLRKNNNNTIYFGPNTTLETIRFYIDQHPVDQIYTHVITHLCHNGTTNLVQSLCNDFSAQQIILSGPASKCVECLEKVPENLKVLHSFDEMIEFSKENG